MKVKSRLFSLLAFLLVLNSCKTYSEEQKQEFNEEVEAFVKENKLETDVTDTGLHFKVLEKGEGKNIRPTDRFILSYRGLLTDSTVFCQDTDTFKLHESEANKRVIMGWREGLTFFNKGSKGFLVVPPHLGYADKDINVKCDESEATDIPANSILIYEVEVLDVW